MAVSRRSGRAAPRWRTSPTPAARRRAEANLVLIQGGIADDDARARGRALADSPMQPAWGPHAAELWAPWSALTDWEVRLEDTFGDGLSEEVLVLWAISRFGSMEAFLGELVGPDLKPRFGDLATEDIVRVAFALGAGWGAAHTRDRAGEPVDLATPHRRPHAVDGGLSDAAVPGAPWAS